MSAGPERTVVIVGPDLERRGEVADAVVEAARLDSDHVEHVRWRSPSTTHRRARHRLPSLLHLVAQVAAFRVRWHLRWRTAARGGVLVIEGSWADCMFHPQEFGLWPGLIAPGRVAARLAPRADLAVVVDASPTPRRRPGESADWQPWAWIEYAPWFARVVVAEANTERPDAMAAVVDAVRAPLPDVDDLRWLAVPLSRTARDVRATAGPGGAEALDLLIPTRRAGRIARAANRVFVDHALAVPTTSPVDGVVELCAGLDVVVTGMATFASPERGRTLVSVTDEVGAQVVIKVGPAGDAGLEHEESILRFLADRTHSFIVPEVRWFGRWRGQDVLVLDALHHRGIADLDDDEVLSLCLELWRIGSSAGPIVHGDLAPWNLLDTPVGTAVLDWEHARFVDEPMSDLVHLVVQDGAQRRADPLTVARRLTAPGSVGWRYLDAIGIAPSQAPAEFERYLSSRPGRDDFAERVYRSLAE